MAFPSSTKLVTIKKRPSFDIVCFWEIFEILKNHSILFQWLTDGIVSLENRKVSGELDIQKILWEKTCVVSYYLIDEFILYITIVRKDSYCLRKISFYWKELIFSVENQVGTHICELILHYISPLIRFFNYMYSQFRDKQWKLICKSSFS